MVAKSESIKELASALSKAQGQIKGAAKDSANPYFKSKYADLASVWDACRDALVSNGLAIAQFPSADGLHVTIESVLTHESGEWMSQALTVSAKDDTPQAVGSAITYARRYALASITGVAPEDDDGEAAMGRSEPPVKEQTPRRTKKQAIDELKQEADLATADQVKRYHELDKHIQACTDDLGLQAIAEHIAADLKAGKVTQTHRTMLANSWSDKKKKIEALRKQNEEWSKEAGAWTEQAVG